MSEEQKVVARPKNWLTPVALVILLHEHSSYGYELMERIASEFESEQINAGTLYRTLRQLEKEGLCDSAWDTSQQRGPARRMYYITEAGKAYLEAWLEACKEYRRVMDALSQAYISRTAPRSSSEQHGNDDEEEVSSSSSS
ncbi:MAG: helix-turn-helix transcriptional regulator [Actinomycetota bacterium]|nr:helix-turn-helix transcriptional regulator [Actinomycetota bacterium]